MRWYRFAAMLGLLGCNTLNGVQSSMGSHAASAKKAMDNGRNAVSSTAPQSHDDPDGDGSRAQAKAAKPNEMITDEIGLATYDGVDWKKYELQGHTGAVKVRMRWDDPTADLNVDLFDSFGANVAASPVRQRAPEKRLVTFVRTPGTYFVRVIATAGASVYTLQLEWAEPLLNSASHTVPASTGGSSNPPATPRADDPRYPRCNVVQSYRDRDGQMILYLDRGSDAGFHAGLLGTLLIGKEGDVPLDGGSLRIIAVKDRQRSIARSSVTTVGPNTRARIDLVAPGPAP